ncbi:hypothetical protein IF650_06195 [Cellulosimicrobium terreum]|nr:hypothetical protein [Cellulosimicrobium terreum]
MSGVDERGGAGDVSTSSPPEALPVAPVLVRDYRRLLRLFPYTYRRAHEAEMLGHLLDAARPGQSRPAPGERSDLLRAAARAWLLAPLGSTPQQRRAATGMLFVLLPAVLMLMAARVIAYAAALSGAVRGGNGSPSLVAVAPTAIMWAIWLVAVVVTLAGARRVGAVVGMFAAATGITTLVVLVATGHAYAAYLEVPWVVGLLAHVSVLAGRETCRVGRESLRLIVGTVWATTLVLGAYVAVTYADSIHLGVPWWSGYALRSWTPQAIVVPAVVLLGAALLWGRTRQAVPVLSGIAVAALLSRSTFFWSGNLQPQSTDLGNVLALLAFTAVATIGARWVVNRLDELSEARASHRRLLAAAGGTTPTTLHPGEPTAA